MFHFKSPQGARTQSQQTTSKLPAFTVSQEMKYQKWSEQNAQEAECYSRYLDQFRLSSTTGFFINKWSFKFKVTAENKKTGEVFTSQPDRKLKEWSGHISGWFNNYVVSVKQPLTHSYTQSSSRCVCVCVHLQSLIPHIQLQVFVMLIVCMNIVYLLLTLCLSIISYSF